MDTHERLKKKVELQARRMKQAERDRPTLLAQTVYLGTLGLLFVLPIVAGAYLGQWLDSHAGDYSIKWTIGLLLAGLVIGVVNVYVFVRSRE